MALPTMQAVYAGLVSPAAAAPSGAAAPAHDPVLVIREMGVGRVVQSMDDVLASTMRGPADVLADLPGTPAQVLINQFAYYARKNFLLAEELRQNTDRFVYMVNAVRRLKEAQ